MLALGLVLLVVVVYGVVAWDLWRSMTKYPRTDRARWPTSENDTLKEE